MTWSKLSFLRTKLAKAIALALVSFTTCSDLLQAQTTKPTAVGENLVKPGHEFVSRESKTLITPLTSRETQVSNQEGSALSNDCCNPSSHHKGADAHKLVAPLHDFLKSREQRATTSNKGSVFTGSNAKTVRFVPPTLPDRGITSGRQRGGASRRGQCPNVTKPLTALVPATQEALHTKQADDVLMQWQSVLGLVNSESPTFWFYVPYSLTPLLPMQFVLQDSRGNYVYKTSFTAVEKPGIISFRLPERLEVGKMYQWYFAIGCAQTPTFVKGWVQRITLNPTLMTQLKAATPRERIALYAANGIWHDALTTLASLRRTYPQDATLVATWENLLQSVDLQDIAKEPIGNREMGDE